MIEQTGGPAASPARALLCATAAGLFCAAVGLAFSLHSFADRVLPHILAPASNIVAFQGMIPGRPVPQLLNWSYPIIGWLQEFRDVTPVLTLLAVLAAVALWLISVHIQNPTFRPVYRAASEAPSRSVHLMFDRVHIEQAVRLLVLCGMPVLALWIVAGGLGNEPFFGRKPHLTGLQLSLIDIGLYVSLGIALFAGYSQLGMAGAFGILHQAYTSDEAAVPPRQNVGHLAGLKLAAVGCLFGAVMWAIERSCPGPPGHELLDVFEALGTFNRAYMVLLAAPYLASVALASLAIGALFYGIARPGLSLSTRAAVCVIPALAIVPIPGLSHSLARDVVAARYDADKSVMAVTPPYDQRRPTISLPMGPVPAAELARHTGIRLLGATKPPFKDMVVFDPGRGVLEVELDEITDDAVITETARTGAVQTYLVSRGYRSALSWVAIKYLFNDANLRFDSTAELRYGLSDMENAPHLLNMGDTVRQVFFLCSASPANLKLLDEYADESRFVHPTRDSLKEMGQMYTRFGQVDRALYWYRRAEMPKSFIQQVKTERPLFHTGTVTGRLTWNGKPLAGVQVGAVPHRLNGLPVDMQPDVLHYTEQLAGLIREASPLFSPYHPRPFCLRWIMGGTTTAPDGSFTLDHLTEGEYQIVCTLPEGVKLTVPFDPELKIQHPAPAVTVSYQKPTQDLGAIAFTYGQKPQIP